MSRGSIIYIFGVVALLLLAIGSYNPSKNWNKTYFYQDDNPYGSLALGELSKSFFDSLEYRRVSFYEMLEADSTANVISISEDLILGGPSFDQLLSHVHEGNTVLISSHYLDENVQDSLGIRLESMDNFNYGVVDSTTIRTTSGLTSAFYSSEITNYLDSIPENSKALLFDDYDQVLAVDIPIGKGRLVYTVFPEMFTNYFMLYENNHALTAELLSYLPQEKRVLWTSYYQLGAGYSTSPLRSILSYPPLRYALYLCLFLIAPHIVFGSRRVQRAIPIIKKLPNQTLDFIHTVGQLYFNQKDRFAIAKNRMDYFKENIRLKHGAHWPQDSDKEIAAKIGSTPEDMKALSELMKQILETGQTGDEQLVMLDQKINAVYKTNRQ